MNAWGVSVKDVLDLVVVAGVVFWHFAKIDKRLSVLESLVQMLVSRSGMTDKGGDD